MLGFTDKTKGTVQLVFLIYCLFSREQTKQLIHRICLHGFQFRSESRLERRFQRGISTTNPVEYGTRETPPNCHEVHGHGIWHLAVPLSQCFDKIIQQLEIQATFLGTLVTFLINVGELDVIGHSSNAFFKSSMLS